MQNLYSKIVFLTLMMSLQALGQVSLLHQVTGNALNIGRGRAVDGMGDIDGDGCPDFLVTSNRDSSVSPATPNGEYGVYSGMTGALIYLSPIPGYVDESGLRASAVGDINGDGKSDFLVGSRLANGQTGSVRLYSGADGSFINEIFGASFADRFGETFDGIGDAFESGDVNNDNLPDIVVGAPGFDMPGINNGGLVQVLTSGGAMIWCDTGTNTGDQLGSAVARAGDVDGDGVGDVLVGAIGAGSNGEVRVYSGSSGVVLFTIAGDGSAGFGNDIAAAGDVNDDGFDDFIIGGFSTPGQGERVYSGLDGSVLYSFATLSGSTGRGHAGDVNCDGFADFMFASSDGSPGPGFLNIHSGRDGTILHVVPGTSNSAFGVSVASVGDINGDEFDDIIVGAPGEDLLGITGQGSANVFIAPPFAYYEPANPAHVTPLVAEWLPTGGNPQSLTGSYRCTGATPGALGIFGVSLARVDTLFSMTPLIPLLIANDSINLPPEQQFNFGFDALGEFVTPVVSRSTMLVVSHLYVQFFELSPVPASSNGIKIQEL